jgi:hypothetical protein
LKHHGVDEYKSEESLEDEVCDNSSPQKGFGGFGNAILDSRSSDDFDVK